MKSLFIDTSTKTLTIAILENNKLLSNKTSETTNEHSKYALDLLKKAFDETLIKPNEIEKIFVINGPGSFTGVRIGVTIAKTYAWALEKKLVPISSLFAHALSYDGYDYYVSLLDARRGFVYAAIYDREYNFILKEQYISIVELNGAIEKLNGSIIIIGDISINYSESSPLVLDVPKIITHCKDYKTVPAHSLKPNYLKRVEAEEKLMAENK
ncbi:MAG TPA: tRNA (adenosine(37)-N6)-threonylcarbamoyltransferase complex dimerization subunit type 1 TsaB [Mollicutes bacterium]|nr:tRNA (adenosine(37)-N6)-threonylcarbamoyltransferase complex dimerization subunit type 1 TsaB [Mollicutes bacterium]